MTPVSLFKHMEEWIDYCEAYLHSLRMRVVKLWNYGTEFPELQCMGTQRVKHSFSHIQVQSLNINFYMACGNEALKALYKGNKSGPNHLTTLKEIEV